MIEFKTKLNENKFKKLSNFQFKKILILLLLISVVIIACGIINIFQGNLIFGILWICFGVLYIPCFYFITKILQNKFDITTKVTHPDADESYFFNDNFMTIIQTNGKDFNSKGTYKYSDLYKIYKTKNDYVIYLNKDYVRILPFDSITSGSIKSLNEILTNKMGKYFIKKHFSI